MSTRMSLHRGSGIVSPSLRCAVFAALLALVPAARVIAQTQPAPAPAETPAPAEPAADAVAPEPTPAADTPATASDTSLADEPATPAPAAAGAASREASGGMDKLTVDFPDMEIREILRNVADLFELNIIMPDTLQGRTTIKLRDVTWRQIFQYVLEPVGFTYVEEGNIVKIVSNESLLQEPVATDVFLINYARASDILPTISSLVDANAGGRIVVDARTNALVITERPSRMSRIRAIIEQLDRATDQVMIESKFVEVTDSDVKNIGVNWSSLAAYQISAGEIENVFTRNRGQTFERGVQGTDGTTRQTSNTSSNNSSNTQTNGSDMSNTVTVTNGAPTSTSTTGSTSSLQNTSTAAQGSTSTNGSSSVLDNLLSLANTGGTERTLNAVFSATDFNLVLSALQTLQKTKVISNPTIVTLNNTQAMINVGEERPIPSYTYNSERGVYEVSGFQYRPIGVILRVTPQVNAAGVIKLTVEPEVSQSTRDASFQGAAIPIVESRKATTTVQLKDGYTMGIGGLMSSTSRNGSTKVPVLGAVPGLGRLFRSNSRNEEMTNLIIFITAKTLSAEGAPIEQVFDSRRVREMELQREDLPGYRDGSDPFVTPPPPEPEKKKKGFFRRSATTEEK